MFLSKKKECVPASDQNLIIPVPDIKQYLVQEYEKVRQLEVYTRELETQLEEAEILQHKYDAAMITLDEYKKRLDRYERDIKSQQEKTAEAKKQADVIRNDLNSYKIKFNQAALEKEEIENEIIEETKEKILVEIANFKGSLSKTKVIELVKGVKRNEAVL